MKFEMWTWYHILYIISPFIAAAALFFLIRNKSQRTKYLVAVAFAIINMAILILRNVDIAINRGLPQLSEIIPLGPCHFANILFLIAVFTKKQQWYNISWCLNLPFGFLATVFANSLENYSTMLAIRPMVYIFGHFFLVLSILYVFLVGLTQFDKQSFKKSMIIAGVWLGVCIVTNTIFNSISQGNYGLANYMYLVKPEGGTPLDIIFIKQTNFAIFNTTINPVYIILLSLVGLVLFFLFHILHQFLRKAQTMQKGE